MDKMVKYQLQVYFKGSSFVMPLVATALFLFTMYSMKPLDVVSGYVVSSIFGFFLMLWISSGIVQKKDPVMEQILYLRVQNAGRYYAGKTVFLEYLLSMQWCIVSWDVGYVIENCFGKGEGIRRCPQHSNDVWVINYKTIVVGWKEEEKQ